MPVHGPMRLRTPPMRPPNYKMRDAPLEEIVEEEPLPDISTIPEQYHPKTVDVLDHMMKNQLSDPLQKVYNVCSEYAGLFIAPFAVASAYKKMREPLTPEEREIERTTVFGARFKERVNFLFGASNASIIMMIPVMERLSPFGVSPTYDLPLELFSITVLATNIASALYELRRSTVKRFRTQYARAAYEVAVENQTRSMTLDERATRVADESIDELELSVAEEVQSDYTQARDNVAQKRVGYNAQLSRYDHVIKG